ncbi:hypothetical protein P879_08901 [Paragonimus westermani]|uniref:Uncharacterized protein n=1 Tax=Paragonimus westermani TaxID=34504 RepID=A0A8T0DGR6_9TREM|nr:hypothetical protein P879_08901 [Paragonimus westermani]
MSIGSLRHSVLLVGMRWWKSLDAVAYVGNNDNYMTVASISPFYAMPAASIVFCGTIPAVLTTSPDIELHASCHFQRQSSQQYQRPICTGYANMLVSEGESKYTPALRILDTRDSSRIFPLHLVSNISGAWRPHGDHRSLSKITTLD